jgi:hypothetical protein
MLFLGAALYNAGSAIWCSNIQKASPVGSVFKTVCDKSVYEVPRTDGLVRRDRSADSQIIVAQLSGHVDGWQGCQTLTVRMGDHGGAVDLRPIGKKFDHNLSA